MNRREFIALPSAAVAAAVLGLRAAAAQQIHKVGWLFPGPAKGVPPRIAAFREGLREAGFRLPEEVKVLARVADGDHSRLEPMARDLIDRHVDVIVAFSPAVINVVLRAAGLTGATPAIVAMSLVSDPVDSGWVKSLAQPGGNLTGLFLDFPEISKKWLQLLKETVPAVARVAVFWDPATGTMQRAGVEQAAKILNVELDIVAVRKREDLDAAFASARRRGAGAVLLLGSPLFGVSVKRLADLALKYRLPAITQYPSFPRVGGLMGYGPDVLDSHRQMGAIVGKVLQGRKPADLPVERHSRFELVVNRKTATALGVTIPPSILIRADKVIE